MYCWNLGLNWNGLRDIFPLPKIALSCRHQNWKNNWIKGRGYDAQVHATDIQSGNYMHSTSLQTMVTKQKITLHITCDNCLFPTFFWLLSWRLPSLQLIFKLLPLSTNRGLFLLSLNHSSSTLPTYQHVLRNIPLSPSSRSDIWWLITFKKLRV